MSKAGKTQEEIAEALGIRQSTVSKELARNRGQRGYRPRQAQSKASQRQNAKKKRSRVIVDELEAEVRRRLELKHSPEQISLRLKKEGIFVSHESIYRYIREDKRQGGVLYKHLRINGKRRYRRRAKAGRTKIPNRIDIEDRPKVVEERTGYGDWEVDLIEGTKGSGFILSLYERKSRLGKLMKLETKSSEETTAAVIGQLEGYVVKTLTYDNGPEFSGHSKITEALGAGGYFCKPYHSWEKGGVENFNGLVRQYLPKGTSFTDLTVERLKEIEEEINHRPRKVLNIKSPSELEYKLAA
jgi:IS30 family transposase